MKKQLRNGNINNKIMKEYVIICKMYLSKGGFFRFATNAEKETRKFNYKRDEREEFIKKAEYLFKEYMYYDDIRMYFLNYDSLTMTQITKEGLNAMKEAI